MIHLWHGFLGLPQDWSHLEMQLRRNFRVPLRAANLFEDYAGLDFEEIPRNFEKEVDPKVHPKNVIVAYSMGARMALKVALEKPNLVSGLVIVSAATGGLNPEQRLNRIKLDEMWAKKFLCWEWEELMNAWEEQSVFEHSPRLERLEADFDRGRLSHALRHWSVAQQRDVQHRLHELSCPVLWCVGELDQKFLDMAYRARLQNSRIQVELFEGAGHRLFLEQPEKLADKIKSFLAPFSSELRANL